MVAYSSGVIAVFLVFFLLNWNAYRQREALGLTRGDLYDIGTALRAHASSTLLGLTSVILAITLPMTCFASVAGPIYALEGPLQGLQTGAVLGAATRESASFIDASAPVSSSRDRQVQKRM